MYTVDSSHKGHIWAFSFVLCKEIVPTYCLYLLPIHSEPPEEDNLPAKDKHHCPKVFFFIYRDIAVLLFVFV